uniref:Ig-like domain-containing protein n=1 Tax=Astyanax mexicanus TaxID=7994 RepID=A0A3B1K8J5_ASTMX
NKPFLYFRNVILTVKSEWATSNEDIVFLERIKFSHVGENISLTCNFTSLDATATAWFKQIPGEKPLRIVSAFRAASVEFDNGFDKRGRFIALREANKFTLNITNAETSDSAIYYCSVAAYASIGLGTCTVLRLFVCFLIQKKMNTALNNTLKQCSILTNRCSEDHSVYWFRHGSGESDPGIIFTHGNRSDQCKKSSETVSPTQSCIYKLPKNNLSLSDAGTYYCAVAACGEILFGNGTKLDFTGGKIRYFNIEVIGGHEIFSHMFMNAENTDDVNYAALSIAQPSFSTRSRVKNSSDQPVYSKVFYHQ